MVRDKTKQLFVVIFYLILIVHYIVEVRNGMRDLLDRASIEKQINNKKEVAMKNNLKDTPSNSVNTETIKSRSARLNAFLYIISPSFGAFLFNRSRNNIILFTIGFSLSSVGLYRAS